MRNLFLVGIVGFLFGCTTSESLEITDPEIEAVADIYSISLAGDDIYEVHSEKIGTAKFAQAGSVVSLSIELSGMTPNSSKAVHIHNGTVNEPGRHWNQNSFYAFCNERSMGSLWAKPFAGDVGNVPIDADGNGTLTLRTDLWALNSGDEKDILDKVVIIHQDPENFVEECDPQHSHDHAHSNVKIGGGTITLITDIEQASQMKMSNFPDFTICK